MDKDNTKLIYKEKETPAIITKIHLPLRLFHLHRIIHKQEDRVNEMSFTLPCDELTAKVKHVKTKANDLFQP